ncbi:hypothetical protein I204_08082 [Kwoniella mangroviensis CBS 8886]|uniref:uncharacterized protein n=1 Tax=Kwoniella mangroviensis CBS 8507 TaxID=1296122 RepID=UPI00080D15E1|nr:uncharacterized protein I203_04559 [Kwoniella mangroviensis CBS 8507]OCF66232.1 hypothetical protein I203_04559 [Kwoniella mangroviensis CBS 8507]OCF71130.1 hypothetical protein I204_08082 [Kwoniella mangroviensis CBS 8886]
MSTPSHSDNRVTYADVALRSQVVVDFHLATKEISQLREIPTSDQSGNTKPREGSLTEAKDFQDDSRPQTEWGGKIKWTNLVDGAFIRGKQGSEALKDFRTATTKAHRNFLGKHVNEARRDWTALDANPTIGTWFDTYSSTYFGRYPREENTENKAECHRLNSDYVTQAELTNQTWGEWLVEDLCHSSEEANYSSFGVLNPNTHNWPLIKSIKPDGTD